MYMREPEFLCGEVNAFAVACCLEHSIDGELLVVSGGALGCNSCQTELYESIVRP
jgi:hypothetical protein